MSNSLLFALSAAWILIALIWINRKKIGHAWRMSQQRRHLDRLGLKQRQNVLIPNGLEGCYKIDRLILLPDSLLLLMQRDYPGRIYGAESIEEWSQVLPGGSFKFKNPLYELDQQVSALEALLPKVRIVSAVYFDLNSQFPKGRPHRVLQADDIPAQYRHRNEKIETPVAQAWRDMDNWINDNSKTCELQ